MESYRIKITEKFEKDFIIIADSFEDAVIAVKQKYKRNEIEINSSDYRDTTFESVDFSVEFQTLVNELINYIYREEEKRFTEIKSDKKNADHIFLKLNRLKELNTHW